MNKNKTIINKREIKLQKKNSQYTNNYNAIILYIIVTQFLHHF